MHGIHWFRADRAALVQVPTSIEWLKDRKIERLEDWRSWSVSHPSIASLLKSTIVKNIIPFFPLYLWGSCFNISWGQECLYYMIQAHRLSQLHQLLLREGKREVSEVMDSREHATKYLGRPSNTIVARWQKSHLLIASFADIQWRVGYWLDHKIWTTN